MDYKEYKAMRVSRRVREEEFHLALKRLWKTFAVGCGSWHPELNLRQLSSRGGSANGQRITLDRDASWRTFAHELAHAVEDRMGVWRRRQCQGKRNIYHNKEFKRLVERIYRKIQRRGYDRGSLVETRAWNENTRRNTAAEPVREDPRIAEREAQIERLEGKKRLRLSQIKALDTRVKKLRQSLVMLRRYDVKRAASRKEGD